MKKYIVLLCLILCITSLAYSYTLEYVIEMDAGEDYRLEMTMKDADGNLIDLTGYSYKAQFRKSPAPNGVVYATYSAVFTNATAGRIDLRLSKAQTLENSGKIGVWDLRETNPSGLVAYPVGGKAVCGTTVTR